MRPGRGVRVARSVGRRLRPRLPRRPLRRAHTEGAGSRQKIAPTLANKFGINLGQSDTHDLGEWEQSLSPAEQELLRQVGQAYPAAAYEYKLKEGTHAHQKD